METIDVCAVIDIRNWAWDIKIDMLQQYIDPKFNIVKRFTRDEPSPTVKECNEEFDLILAFAWGGGTEGRGLYKQWNEVKTKKVLCKCSHFMARQAAIMIAPQFDATIVNNTFLMELFEGNKLYYCPNGVDTNLFYPEHKEHKGFKIGYVGNGKSTGQKGFTDIIEPNVEEKLLFGMNRETDAVMPHNWMPKYYNSLDTFLVMSKWEGTPNPGLEAMACGIPVISTEVGNMVEIIKDGYNGFLIERDAKPMLEKIQYYKDNPNERKKHGLRVQKEIKEKWSWEEKVKNYELAFEDVLSI